MKYLLRLLFIAVVGVLPTVVQAQTESVIPGQNGRKEAINYDYFPHRQYAFVWRNWAVVSKEKIAEILSTSVENVESLATSMGLPAEQNIEPEWATEQGYITVLRRNWHLLPYEQITQLLGMSREELKFRLIEDDFLKLKLENVFEGKPFVLTGNYPYNISSQIFFKMLDYKDLIPCCTGMIQKEVAERIAAGPGSKTYGILSVLIQAWYKVEYLFTVHEHVFNPPPKVKSAVIRMTRNETTDLGCDEKLFKQIVKTTFNQRRKTLRNSIASILDKSHPLSADPIFNKRPEQLSVQEFVELTNRVEAALAEAKNRE